MLNLCKSQTKADWLVEVPDFFGSNHSKGIHLHSNFNHLILDVLKNVSKMLEEEEERKVRN